jgi:hypothetical protein
VRGDLVLAREHFHDIAAHEPNRRVALVFLADAELPSTAETVMFDAPHIFVTPPGSVGLAVVRPLGGGIVLLRRIGPGRQLYVFLRDPPRPLDHLVEEFRSIDDASQRLSLAAQILSVTPDSRIGADAALWAALLLVHGRQWLAALILARHARDVAAAGAWQVIQQSAAVIEVMAAYQRLANTSAAQRPAITFITRLEKELPSLDLLPEVSARGFLAGWHASYGHEDDTARHVRLGGKLADGVEGPEGDYHRLVLGARYTEHLAGLERDEAISMMTESLGALTPRSHRIISELLDGLQSRRDVSIRKRTEAAAPIGPFDFSI